ncbi:MAG: double-strand break repair helicase AddA [Sphingomonadales bacterium]|nr:MAG: double-strand break repair helicase AddA [Sphingomonadales bacterium]TNF05674.1 MAG: double-strand break repair helicase AddA [Sphingomonadales bacterium]
MAKATTSLLPLRGAQADASAPDAHVWLSASAGTGKTHVLTARVFRLLLGGVPPEHILCLTFTKAGASEMAERVHGRLAAWVRMSDADLAIDLKALGEELSPEARDHARRLFARVLEATGGGLRIQTIHSFCQQLLSAFPLEAGLVPGFRALEEREQKELARESLEDMVVRAEETGDVALLDALHALSLRLGEKEAEAYLARCAQAHDVLHDIKGGMRGWLFAALDLPQGDIDAEIAARCADTMFDMAALHRLARANAAWNTKTGLGHADAIAAWIAASPAHRAETLDSLAACFLTAKGEFRKVSAGQEKADPDYGGLAVRIGEWIAEMQALRLRVAYADCAAKGLHAGRAFATAYEEAKRRVGAVDYDDLIGHSASLLMSPGIADWIRYKLDQRIDHILVDEAQDTNSRQWAIIGALVEEFFAGEGSRGQKLRTLFTVGDFKQAIFGFQGTSPRAFAHARDYFRDLARAVEHRFHDLSLDESFRSTPPVLEVVDRTVATLGVEALGLSSQAVLHRSMREYPGEVCLWKPVSAVPGPDDMLADDGEPEGEEDWLADQDRLLAERIAGQIRDWLASGRRLESQGRPMRPGDVMILVRKRGDLARLIVARLYEAGVPVAGVDRLRLQAPLGVQDLVAALRFASQPEDDLNLAALLVSPLIGWTQEELLARAVPRRGGLWRHLRSDPAMPAAAMTALQGLLNRADFVTPYQMLEHILSGPMCGRRHLVERLGIAVGDNIDELLNAALAYEQGEQPSLQGFLHWFDSEEGDIKREQDGQGDAVRLLTVHGAKGLQAPVVILADACADPDQAGRRGALEVPLAEDRKLPLVSPRKGERWGVVEAAATAQDMLERQEHWRLLYVAMTRAEEKLFVTGAMGPKAKGVVPRESWYAAIERAMDDLGAGWDEDVRWGAVMPWRGSAVWPPCEARKTEGSVVRADTALPGWIDRPAPDEARPPRPLAPTVRLEDDLPYPPPSPAMREAALRGTLLHSLFERLPDVAADRRREAADQWLATHGGVTDGAQREEMIGHALSLIEDPAHADLFGPLALAEAPVAAVVGEDVVTGVIDRLVIGEALIRLVDFKTGRRIPRSMEDLPPAHVRQMAAYAAALEAIFPGRRVEAALLYTAGPVLWTLPDDLLRRHKPGLSMEQ